MTVDELMDAFNNRSPVIVERFRGLEPPLHFSRITAVIPAFDKNGQPDYGVEVIDSVGRICTARGKDVRLG